MSGAGPLDWQRFPALDPELVSKLEHIDRETARARLNIFRAYMRSRVCLASPLLLDACRPGELDEAAWRLRPGRSWPRKPSVRVTVRGWSSSSAHFGPVEAAMVGPDGRSVIVSDMLAIRLTNRAAHMVLRVGDASLVTTDGGGSLLLPWLLDGEQVPTMAGSPLDRLMIHPATARGDYLIRSAMPDAARGRTVVEFMAAPLEWRLPWGRPPSCDPF